MQKVSKIKADKDLKKSIKQAVEGIGGFDFIKKGEVVLLKPNFNTQDPFPASSDILFLKAVVDLVYERDPKGVIIGESSTLSLNTRKVMQEVGLFDLMEKMPIPPRIYNFDERAWIEKKIPNAKYLKKVKIPKFLDRADKLILLPCLKTHNLAQFTGALKLSVGFMKPYQRTPLHLWHLQKKIAELNTIIKPNLIIMDARKCFINKGPSSGRVAEPNLIMASKSRVAIDVEGIKIIQNYKGNSLKGADPLKITQIKKALELGVK